MSQRITTRTPRMSVAGRINLAAAHASGLVISFAGLAAWIVKPTGTDALAFIETAGAAAVVLMASTAVACRPRS